jgi:hypothetical protein
MLQPQEKESILNAIGPVIDTFTATQQCRRWMGFWNKCTLVGSLTVVLLSIMRDLMAAQAEEEGVSVTATFDLSPGVASVFVLGVCFVASGYYMSIQHDREVQLKQREIESKVLLCNVLDAGGEVSMQQKKKLVAGISHLASIKLLTAEISSDYRMQETAIKIADKLCRFISLCNIALSIGSMGFGVFALGVLVVGIQLIGMGISQLIELRVKARRANFNQLQAVQVDVDTKTVDSTVESILKSGIPSDVLERALSCG